MKIIHTADWHLGQQLYGYDRSEEQRCFLGQLQELVAEHRPDALVISGDVFDTSSPSNAIQRLYTESLLAIRRCCPNLIIVVIAGNHDSASRLEIHRQLWMSQQVHVVGSLCRTDAGVDYSKHIIDVNGKGFIAAVPYVYAHNYPPADNGADRQTAFFRQLEEEVQKVNREQLPTVLMAHLAVTGCDLTGHRRLQNDSIGTLEYTPADVLGRGYHYVALGHIHRNQRMGSGMPAVCYAGSPLPVSFDEPYQHTVSLVTLQGNGAPLIEKLPIDNPHPLVTLPAEPVSFADALRALKDFPDGDTSYIRLNVRAHTSLPADHNEQAIEVTKGKKCRFCTIQILHERNTAAEAATNELTPDELKAMTVTDIARQYMQSRGLLPEVQEAYLEMIHQIEKEKEEEDEA